MEKQRIEWIDSVKFFCIIAVLTEHVECVPPIWDRFVEPFFLNMFSFAAGYVYFHKDGFRSFFRKKIRQLLIPWFFFSTLTIIMAHIFSFNVHESLWRELGLNMLQIMYHGSEMWYIAALFVAFIPFYFFIRAYSHSLLRPVCKELKLILISFVLCAGSYCFAHYAPRDMLPWGTPGVPLSLPWHLEYMFQAMFFMVLGYLFRQHYEPVFDRLVDRKICVFLCISYLIIDLLLPELISLSPLADLLLYYPRAILGCSAVIAVSKQLHPNAYTRFVGRNTLCYYGLHGKAESLVQACLKAVNEAEYLEIVWGYHPEAVFYALAEALLVSVMLIPVALLINRYLPFAVGRRKSVRA